MSLTPGDLDIVARTVYGEARGESFEGKKAVVHVIINRTNHKASKRDHSLAATALRWRQFSAWNTSDPNRRRMEATALSDETFRECMRAVLTALDEIDPTKGSRHYHTNTISPGWARGHKPVAAIGSHVFYNDVA